MKYVCKKPFSYIIDRAGGKVPRFVKFNPGDTFEYIGIDESGMFEFVDKFGEHVRMDFGCVEDWLNECEDTVRDKLCRVLGEVCKIEADVAELRGQLESILLDLE